MNCWFCGGKVIWGADFNPDEMGYDEGETGVVACLTCSVCGATYEAAYLDSQDPRQDNEPEEAQDETHTE